jgi:protein ImuB
VLWEKQKGAMRLVAVDEAASAVGLSPGQSLSDARAMVPDLEAREIDRLYLEQVFADFADWHSNASPIVSVLTHTEAYGDLCLDITGVSHLFGGEAAMLEQLTNRLRTLGYSVEGAIASTIGAAWAVAHYLPGRIIAPGDESKALSAMPVSALRLDPMQIEGLTQLGLKRIGQLYERDRKSLQARFGVSFLLRLDQALGWVEEKLDPRLPIAEWYAEHRFAEPIGLIDDVLMCTHDLSVQLATRLERESVGAQGFHLFLYRVDHKVITLSINASRATRDAHHISRLFAYRAERLGAEYDAGFGIDMIRLAANSISPLEASQVGAFGRDDGTQNLEHLYDRMTSRLGPLAVVRSKPVNSYIPERALLLEPVVAKTPDDATILPVTVPRPMRLLPHPEPILVIAEVPDAPPASMTWRRVNYRFVKASGPERISDEWQRAGQKLQLTEGSLEAAQAEDAQLLYFEEGRTTRDYYVVEDDGGRRFWLFRLGLFGIAAEPRWFLQGFFS